MGSSYLCRLAMVAALVSIASCQAIWSKDQVNTTICVWEQPRAALLRDTVYLDGGALWWTPGLRNGQLGSPDRDDNPLGHVYTLNFSKPFKTTDNITDLFGILPKGLAGGAASNLAPTYVDGAMLANNHEWFLYGGLLRETAEFTPPPEDSVLGYLESSYGLDKPGFLAGFTNKDLPQGMTRYISYGGAANVPSENKAFYFSGLRSPNKSEIYQTGGSVTATDPSDTLIILDMGTQLQEKWENKTLPPRIKGRANPELVWVPVGKEGILVSLGGVIYPDYSDVIGASPNATESRKTSPSFMSTIDVYDIESGQWFKQSTKDGPGQVTRGCAVVATAQDYSSFNIYYYGGYDGLSAGNLFSDNVWVLSLPSFTWTRVAESDANGRAGHKCFMPYPDRIMVIGGYTSRTGQSVTCLKETIRVFDVNKLTWLDEYNPAVHDEYLVPEVLLKKIGGTATGGATATSPDGGWEENDLGDVFSEAYPRDRIKVFWPYPVAEPDNNTNPDSPPTKDEGGGGGVPKFLPPVLGVVLGLMFLTMIAVLILLYRRRKLFKNGGLGGRSEAGTEDTNGHRIMSWMRGQTSEAKAPTVATSDYNLPSSPAYVESDAPTPAPQQPNITEIMGREVHAPVELMDTSPRAELYDTGLSHTDVIQRYSHLGGTPATGSLNNPSSYTQASQVDHASTLSQSTSAGGQPGFSHHDYRPDSDLLANTVITGAASPQMSQTASPVPALATVSETEVSSHSDPTSAPGTTGHVRNTSRVLSGISNLSDRDRSHLRQISDTSVSSVTTHLGGVGGDRILISPEPGQQPPEHQHHGVPYHQPLVSSPGPVSPPTAGDEGEGSDYMSARSGLSSLVVSPLGDLNPPPPIMGSVIRKSQSSGDGTSSPLRRSVFHESREDMTDDGPSGPPPPLPQGGPGGRS